MSTPNDEAMKASAEQYVFQEADAAAPADHDPNAEGRDTIPPGWYEGRISNVEFVYDKGEKYKGTTYACDQMRPHLEVTRGPHTGKTIMDFLPVPRGSQTPAYFSDRWVNFMKRAGIDVPAGKNFPPGFKANQLVGRPIKFQVEEQWDADLKKPKTRGGEVLTKVKLFGYDFAGPSPASTSATKLPEPTKPASPALNL